QLVVERRVNRGGRTNQEERVTVWCCSHDRFGPNVATCARPIFNHERLTEALRQPLTHQARDDIDCATGSRANHDAYRLRRPSLGPGKARDDGQRGSAGGQMQKLAAGKFHLTPPFKSFAGSAAIHSCLVLANVTTLVHFSVSSAMSLLKSAGDRG